MNRNHLFRALVLALIVGETMALAVLLVRGRWQRAALDTPVQRGRAVALRSGCFGCHGADGANPIPDPGLQTGSVPKWIGGTWMMWNDSPQDIRGWILNGHPAGRQPDEKALIAMPAFRDHLSDQEVDDLVAYVLAVSQFGWPDDEEVSAGRDVALEHGCFGCHGPEGRGLIANPGSLKGYIPPWEGRDFKDLVRGRAEFDQWVRQGTTKRLRENPAARAFLDRQAIKMPAYGDRLNKAQLDQLYAYVMWVRAHPRTGKAAAE
jgi:mono/diheme cytochrome c family protein